MFRYHSASHFIVWSSSPVWPRERIAPSTVISPCHNAAETNAIRVSEFRNVVDACLHASRRVCVSRVSPDGGLSVDASWSIGSASYSAARVTSHRPVRSTSRAAYTLRIDIGKRAPGRADVVPSRSRRRQERRWRRTVPLPIYAAVAPRQNACRQIRLNSGSRTLPLNSPCSRRHPRSARRARPRCARLGRSGPLPSR